MKKISDILNINSNKTFLVLVGFLFLIFADRTGFLIHDALRKGPSSENFIENLVTKNGYLIETHNVTTPDGYILKLHRIPYSPKSFHNRQQKFGHQSSEPHTYDSLRPSQPRPVVFLQHGVLSVSDTWVVKGPRSLAFLLSDAGYDVWMGNARGNTHSRRHIKLDVNTNEFWDFTWHEIGYYDLPTMIDFVLNSTKNERLHYIGHSQGTTAYFVMSSLRPEYNEKVITMHAFSPVAFLTNHKCFLFTVPSYFHRILASLAKALGFGEFLPNNMIFHYMHENFCKTSDLDSNACFLLLSYTGGPNPYQIDIDLIPSYWNVIPGGASSLQLLHFAQIVMSGEFQMYDHGPEENLMRYGQTNPPLYPLGNLRGQLYFYVGENDFISTPKDVETLVEKLSIKPVMIRISDKNWSHFDFLWAKETKELVYDRMIEEMQSVDALGNFPQGNSSHFITNDPS